MSLLLLNPNDKRTAIDTLKTIIGLYIFPGIRGASKDKVIQHVAQMESSPLNLEISARLETFPERKRTVVTLTFDQVEALKFNA